MTREILFLLEQSNGSDHEGIKQNKSRQLQSPNPVQNYLSREVPYNLLFTVL